MHKLLYNIVSSFFPPPQIVQIPENLMTASPWIFRTRSEVEGGRWGSDLANWAGWGRFPSGQSVRKILARAFSEGSCEPELRELLNQRRLFKWFHGTTKKAANRWRKGLAKYNQNWLSGQSTGRYFFPVMVFYILSVEGCIGTLDCIYFSEPKWILSPTILGFLGYVGHSRLRLQHSLGGGEAGNFRNE